ncbi:hypothetical protein [Candidatus Absconditicoccus praedator]|uniref:hypothetical protein n=1 Tax=Candidatus Absconditicoccus praedator TaxID=2735562 RepID=UPI001E40559E|nr:hypothetical protein [Candidatus Absconditicoccus praedator]UFX83094.1 hypothetical protein HLG78_03095 [Candidatus Absconditicoccus praedator]
MPLETMGERLLEQSSSPETQEEQERSEIIENIRRELDSIKQSIESSQEQDFSVREDILNFLDRFNQSFGDSVQQIEQIKHNIESKESLQIEDIHQINEFLSSLTQEQIDGLEDDRLAEAYNTLQDTSRELSNLAEDVSSSLDESRQQVQETAKGSGGIFGFVGGWVANKYTERINDGKSVNSGIWGVGLSVVGWFNSDLKDSILGYKDTKKTYRQAQGELPDGDEAAEVTQEKIDEFKENFKSSVKEKLEEEFGVDVDDEKFERAFSRWQENHNFSEHISDKYDELHEAMYGEGSFNTMGELFDTVLYGPRASIGLILELRKEGLISLRQIGFTTVEKSGRLVVQFGKNSAGLVSNGIETIFGEMEMDDFIDYVKQTYGSFEEMDGASREAILGMLYRHGGVVHTLFRGIGNAFGHLITAPIQVGDDISKLRNVSGHFMDSLSSQMEAWDRISTAFGDSGSALGADGELRSYFQRINTNVSLYHAISTASDYDDFIRRASSLGIDNVDEALRQIGTDELPSRSNFSEYKRSVGNRLGGWFNDFGNRVQSTYGGSLGNIQAYVPGSVNNEARRLGQFLNRYGNLSQKIIDNDSVVSRLRKWLYHTERSFQSAEMADINNSARFYLNSMDDIQDFTRDLRHIARTVPEMLGHFAGNIPLIMLGSELKNKLQDPESREFGEIMRTIGYVFPFIGPALLVGEGFSIKDGEINSWGMAGAGVFIAGVDMYFVVKDIPNHGLLRSVGRHFATPVTQASRFFASLPRASYDMYHFSRKTGRMVASRGVGSLLREAVETSSGRSFLRRGALAGALIAGGYYLVNEYFDNDELPREVRDKMDDPEKMDEVIDELRTNFSKEEKKEAIKYAIVIRLGVDPSEINNSSFEVDLEEDDGQISLRYKLPYSWFGYEDEDEADDIDESILSSQVVSDNVSDIVNYVGENDK